jgi:hypothetical protein
MKELKVASKSLEKNHREFWQVNSNNNSAKSN